MYCLHADPSHCCRTIPCSPECLQHSPWPSPAAPWIQRTAGTARKGAQPSAWGAVGGEAKETRGQDFSQAAWWVCGAEEQNTKKVLLPVSHPISIFLLLIPTLLFSVQPACRHTALHKGAFRQCHPCSGTPQKHNLHIHKRTCQLLFPKCYSVGKENIFKFYFRVQAGWLFQPNINQELLIALTVRVSRTFQQI